MSELLVKLLQRARQDATYRAWLQSATTEELQGIGLKPGQQAVLLSNLLLTTPFRQEDLPDWDARYGHAFQWVDNRTQPIPWTPLTVPLQQAKVALILPQLIASNISNLCASTMCTLPTPFPL